MVNTQYSKDARGKRNNHAHKDDDEVIRIPGGLPAIVEPNTELRREYIEDFVLNEMRLRIFNEKNIPVLVKNLNEHLRKSEAGDQEELKKCRSELGKVSKRLANITAAVSNGNAYQSLLDQMGELEEQKALLETRIQELSADRQEIVVTEDAMRGLFRMFHDAIRHGDIPNIKKFVDSYVERVIVYRNEVEIRFRMTAPESGHDEKPLQISTTETRQKLMNGSDVGA